MISQIASLLLVSLLFIAIPTPFLNFKFLFISSLFTFYCTIGPHLWLLRFKTEHLYNRFMHMPRPLFELRHFVFVLQYKLIKAFNSDINKKGGLQSISIALFCFLERFCGGTK